MKKLIFTLFFALLFTTAISYAQTIDVIVNSNTFSDVDSTDVDILYLAELGIVEGRPDGTVDASGELNRAESLTAFARLFEFDLAYDPSCTFPDVPETIWYAPVASTMCNNGLVQGYPDGTFQGGNQLKKAEAMAILVRGLNVDLQPPYENLPPDVNQEDWFAGYASYVVSRNIVPLNSGLFNGGELYTRGDLFNALYRYKRLEELGESVYSSDLDPQVVESTENVDQTSDEEHVVRYTDSGFEPTTLTIAQGETVTFINESTLGMWVASDFHPTHKVYGGTDISEHCSNPTDATFDQCDSVESGKQWSFTFTQIGSWDYHNHVGPSDTGMVFVE